MNKKLNDATKHIKMQGQSLDFGGRAILNAKLINCEGAGGGGSDPNAVKYTEQSLTDSQKAQARTNIGAGSAADVSANAAAIAAETSRAVAAEGTLQEMISAIDRGEGIVAWDGASTPVVAEIPAGVTVTYNDVDYTGTLAASSTTKGPVYYVADGNGNATRYMVSQSGSTYSWLAIGTTEINLSQFATKAELSQLDQKVFGAAVEVQLTKVDTVSDKYISNTGGYTTSSSGMDIDCFEVVPGKSYHILNPRTPNGFKIYGWNDECPKSGALDLTDCPTGSYTQNYETDVVARKKYLYISYYRAQGAPTVTTMVQSDPAFAPVKLVDEVAALEETVEGLGTIEDVGMAGAYFAIDPQPSVNTAGNYHKYIFAANGPGNVVSYIDTENACVMRIPVSAGEKYHIRSANYYSFRAWMTVDASDKCVRICESGDTTAVNDYITIQEGETELCLNIHQYGFCVVAKQATLARYNPIAGKLIAFDGSSSCEQRWTGNAKNGGAYPYLLARKYGIDLVNKGKGGATVATNSGASHTLAGDIANLPDSADMYCFFATSNDYALNVPLGTLTSTPTAEVDTDTFIGALEYICRYCLTNFVGKPVVFIIAHKTQNYAFTPNQNGNTQQDFHDAAVACFMKYSIPFYDAYARSGLNGWNVAQSAAYLTANSLGVPDGTHPNEAGYLKYYVGQLYEVLAENAGISFE